jgi:putative DNA primase/helicase
VNKNNRDTGGAALPPIRFAELAAALLARSDQLVPAWLPGGQRRGKEWVCGSLSGGPGDSCQVNLEKGKWADFATDEKGRDLVSLYATINGLTPGKAAVQVARELGLEDVAGVLPEPTGAAPREPRAQPVEPPRADPPPGNPDKEVWTAMPLVPDFAPPPTFRHFHRALADITYTATYRLDGHVLGYTVRYRTSDGGKDVIPYTWCKSSRDGASKWQWKQWEEPRPLYMAAGRSVKAAQGEAVEPPTVVIVEGEKKADALQALLDAGAPGVYLVASWPGGSKAWRKALWDWLANTTVLLWPDCDAKRVPLPKDEAAKYTDELARQVAEAAQPLLSADKQPGMQAMLGIGALLRDSHGCQVQLLKIPEPGEVPDGWDCGDAINVDGWGIERVLQLFASAYGLPASAPGSGSAGGSPGAGAGAAGGGGAGDPPGGGANGPADAEEEGAPRRRDMPLWLKPYWDADKGRFMVSRKLVIAALTQDEALAPVLALNELSNNVEVRQPWPWGTSKPGPLRNSDDLLLGDHLTRAHGLPAIARAALMEAIETVAHARPFHPYREYLQGLQWDGVARIDKWLLYVIGETPQSVRRSLREYLGQVGRFWLLGMVNRVMQPGCKFDYCPVLEGPGGMGKSTLVETLAGSAYYSDTHFDVSKGKEGQEQVQGLVLYEIAELANFGKAEIGLIKAFVTAKVDRYRPSYGRVVEAYPRQCVLVGTTNENTYLRDRTGNRRFWPIPVRQRIKIGWLTRMRDQLLAEAFALFEKGERFTPTPEDERRLFVPMQESRMVETAVVSEMLHVLTRTPTDAGIGAVVNSLTDFVTISQLTTALGVDAAKSNAALEGQIRGYLEHEGWQRVKRQVNGVRAWGYARPAQWPPIELDEPDEFGLDEDDDDLAAGASAQAAKDGGADDEPF